MSNTPGFVPITEEEFVTVYEAIYRNTTPYEWEEVPEIVAEMREARQILDKVIRRADLPEELLSYVDDQTL